MKYSGNSKIYKDIPEDWENQHGWYYYADAVRFYSNGATSNIYKEKSGKISTVKHCEICNRQWQMKWIGPNRKRYYDFYKGLPTYKMKRKVCGKCQETKH